MRLAIFGSQGRLGRVLVQEARRRGHDVLAISRRGEDGGLGWDGGGPDPLSQALHGAQVVVSAIGHSKKTPKDGVSRGTAQLVHAMKAAGVPRIFVVSGALIGADGLGFFYRQLARIVGRSPAVEDRRVQERLVRESGLRFTIVRPPRLHDAPAGPVEVAPRVGIFDSTSRASLAAWILDAVQKGDEDGKILVLRDRKDPGDDQSPRAA